MATCTPPHSGVHIHEDWIVEGRSLSEAARWIGVLSDTLSSVLNGRESLSTELAS